MLPRLGLGLGLVLGLANPNPNPNPSPNPSPNQAPHNRMEALPTGVCGLGRLSTIDLSNNKLRRLG